MGFEVLFVIQANAVMFGVLLFEYENSCVMVHLSLKLLLEG